MYIVEFVTYESEKIAKGLAYLGINVEVSTIEIVQTMILFVLLLIGFVICIVKLGQWIKKCISQHYILNECKKIIPVDYLSYFEDYDKYIDTKFQLIPPNDYTDPVDNLSQVSGQSLISFYLENVLVEKNNSTRFYCILAGSGMGKTTVSVHLCAEYLRRYKKGKHPFQIRLLTLADKDVIQKIEQINNPNETILILDALDENREASEDYTRFEEKLDKAVANFRYVIITCRTQFFQSEDEEPKQTHIPNLGRDKGFLCYVKHYISPLSHSEIEQYLKKKFKHHRRKRKSAENIVKRCSSLMVRPLLLSYIDLLVEKKETYDTVTAIYKGLIAKWIEREVANIKNAKERDKQYELLMKFSVKFSLALLHTDNLSTALRMTAEEYESFVKTSEFQAVSYDYGGRSLINRDSEGRRKFAHKSFFEYFLAVAKFEDPRMYLPKEGLDMANYFYNEMVLEQMSKIGNNGLVYTANTITKEGILELSYPVNFEYLHLQVFNIKEVLVTPIVLPIIMEWLIQSDVVRIRIRDYSGEDLSGILRIPQLRELYIYTDNILRDNHNSLMPNVRLNNNFIKRARKKLDVIEYDNIDITNGDLDMFRLNLVIRRNAIYREYTKIVKIK